MKTLFTNLVFPNTWEACKFPEKMPDRYIEFTVGCEKCELKLRASLDKEFGEVNFKSDDPSVMKYLEANRRKREE